MGALRRRAGILVTLDREVVECLLRAADAEEALSQQL